MKVKWDYVLSWHTEPPKNKCSCSQCKGKISQNSFILQIFIFCNLNFFILSCENKFSFFSSLCFKMSHFCSIMTVQSLSCVRFFATPRTAACQVSLSITKFRSLLKLISIESGMPSNHLILCCSLLLLLSIFPRVRVFSNESVLCIRGPNIGSFSFSISPSNEYSGLISFRMDWMDLLALQGTLRSLLQHHSSKVSILWLSMS